MFSHQDYILKEKIITEVGTEFASEGGEEDILGRNSEAFCG